MENFNDTMELTVRDVHGEDGYAFARKQMIGKKFEAILTLTSVGHPGWYTIIGRFIDKVGVPEIDNIEEGELITISMAKYTL